MSHVPIVQKGDPVLGRRADEVPVETITSPSVQEVISRMHTALAGEPDGVALAAPQIGESLRIFVIADQAYDSDRKERRLVFINPVIVNHAQKKHSMQEGCLSVRWKYGNTQRYKQATVEAYDEHGKKFTMSGSGLIAQIFQHEIDHLDGILFDSHAENVHDLDQAEIEKIKSKQK